MFNLTRQLGGSLGIAIMATLLTRYMVIEKSLLTEHVVAGDPQVARPAWRAWRAGSSRAG